MNGRSDQAGRHVACGDDPENPTNPRREVRVAGEKVTLKYASLLTISLTDGNALLIGIDSVLPKLLQLDLDVFLLESIVLDSGEHLSIDLSALCIAIFDLNPVVHLVDECFKSGVRRHVYLHRKILSDAQAPQLGLAEADQVVTRCCSYQAGRTL